MTSTQELEWLVGELRMRLGYTPQYHVPGAISPVHEYEDEGDVWMEYPGGEGWGDDDDGTHTDGGWSPTHPTPPHLIPTPFTSPVSPPSVGVNSRIRRTRHDPVTQTAVHREPLRDDNSKNITSNDKRGSYNDY